jgi:glycosyltransferase involved in cell wall biosynthesis
MIALQPINQPVRRTNNVPPRAVFVATRGFALANSRLLIMRHLLDCGWRVVALGIADEHVGTLTDAGVQFHEIRFARGGLSLRRDFAAYRALKRCYAELQPALIHHFHAKPVIFGCLAARAAAAGAVVVNTITGLGHAYGRNGLARQLAGTGYRAASRRSSVTVFQNPDDRDEFIHRGLVAAEATRLITGSGVDVEKFRPAEHRGGRRGLRVLMISRLLWDKGVGQFVEAARTCRQAFPQARFQIAGEFDLEHPDAVPIEAVEQWEQEGVVEYLGYLNHVERTLPEVSIVVHPSYYREGVPRVLLEAAACGVPTVTADSPGCREAVVDGVSGLLVPPRDSQRLASAVGELLSDERRRQRMGEAGRAMVESKFDLRTITKRYLELYESLGANVAYP